MDAMMIVLFTAQGKDIIVGDILHVSDFSDYRRNQWLAGENNHVKGVYTNFSALIDSLSTPKKRRLFAEYIYC